MRTDVLLAGEGGGDDPLDAWERGLAWYAANTGHSGDLDEHAGFTASSNNATYEGQDYTGAVTVTGSNVTFRNCRFQYPIVMNGAATVIESCTMDWTPGHNGIDASYGSGTISRCDLTGGGEHFRVVNDVTIEDCWSHHLSQPVNEAHNENVISAGNSSGVTIRRCWLDSADTYIEGGHLVSGAINMSGWAGGFSGWTVDHNLLMGSGYLLGPGTGGPNVYTDNRFDVVSGPQCWGAAYPMDLPAGDTWSGNLTTADVTVPRPTAP